VADTPSHRHTLTSIRRRTLPGEVPGTIAVDPTAPKPVIHLIGYSADKIEEQTVESVEQLPALLERFPVAWVNVAGLGDAPLFERLREMVGIHPLAMEDVVNVHQRPKVELYDEGVFVVVRMPVKDPEVLTRQISLYLKQGQLFTFQEQPKDCLDPVRVRIRHRRGRIRTLGSDYLAYALLDAVVDAFFPAIEDYADRLEKLEDDLLGVAPENVLPRILETRHELADLRRVIAPLRDTLANLYGDDNEFVGDEIRVYLRDCYDHTLQLIDVIETYREVAGGLLEVYVSAMSQRTNEVMRVLTIIATIFMPLTFIAGIYGMNFDPDTSPLNMPELRWYWGYPFSLLLMGLTSLLLLYYFRRKGWLGSGRKRRINIPSRSAIPNPRKR
jgi:magnesium transporter